MRALRAAVAGVGPMGVNHARVYSELDSVDLVAVIDPDGGAAARAARRFKTAPFAQFEEAFRSCSPEIVSIAVPTALHEKVALEVVSFGCHVLVEKPLALSVDAGRRIIAAAHERGVKLAVGHIERVNPAVAAIKDRLRRGELGRVFQVQARRVSPFPGSVDECGVILDLATHDIDVIRHVLDVEVERVFAETQRIAHASCEDLVSALLHLSNGAVGVLDVNWVTPTKIRQLSVLGEGGMYVVDYLTQDLYWYRNGPGHGTWDALSTFRGASEGDMLKIRIDKKEPLRAELEAFVAAVQQDREPAVTGEDALVAIDIGVTLVESGRQNVPLVPTLMRERDQK